MGTIPDLDGAQPELGLLIGLYTPTAVLFLQKHAECWLWTVCFLEQLWGLIGETNTYVDGQSLQSTEEIRFSYCYESKLQNQETTCKVSALKDRYGITYTDNTKVETRSLQ